LNILLLDIETAPNLAYVWGLFKQNIAPSQVEEAGYVLCWAAKWLNDDKVHFSSIKKSTPKVMMGKIHTLLDKADAVVHYNGKKFDIPVLNREFLLHDMAPPAPYAQIDLYHVFKDRFRFESNKLDNVTQRLKLGAKAEHEGFKLWTACMRGDAAAWKRMEAYNRQDVLLLEKLYKRALPWINKHPRHGTHGDIAACPNCGSEKFQQRGYAVTQMQKYRRYQCQDCGSWFRGNKTVSVRLPEKMTQIAA
jgi:DNA-directed RNA polymerase subunit RPC12/RpoP/DNA polymerase elongation subunit (family B)